MFDNKLQDRVDFKFQKNIIFKVTSYFSRKHQFIFINILIIMKPSDRFLCDQYSVEPSIRMRLSLL